MSKIRIKLLSKPTKITSIKVGDVLRGANYYYSVIRYIGKRFEVVESRKGSTECEYYNNEGLSEEYMLSYKGIMKIGEVI